MEPTACTKCSAIDTFWLGMDRGLNERNISLVKGK